jgi:hypothetical protein
VSELGRNEDGSFRWVDGVGTVGDADVRDVKITVTFPNGGQMTGTILASCRQIKWTPTHWDSKG